MTDANAITSMSFSLTDKEKMIVREESIRRGLHNDSATLRLIINEWKELTSAPSADNGNSKEQIQN